MPGRASTLDWLRRISLAVVVGICGLAASAASAGAADFTWSGAAAEGQWSNGTNWGGTAPSGSVGTLTFPALTSAACTEVPPTATCYFSRNDVSGLSVNAISIDDGVSYFISGNAITLGAGGLTASTSLSSRGSPNLHFESIALGASQTWSIDGNNNFSGLVNPPEKVTGTSSLLGVHLSHRAQVDLGKDVEAGAVTITGGDASHTGCGSIENGIVGIGISSLNGTDGNPVSLTDAGLAGAQSSAVGPLTLTGSLFLATSGTTSVSGGVTFDSASCVQLFIDHPGSTAGTDYSQLRATGNVSLGNAHLMLFAAGGQGGSCPALSPGEVDALITTTGSLNGTFAGLADGATVTLLGCSSPTPPTVRINYTEHSVSSTVLTGSGTSTCAADPAIEEEPQSQTVIAPAEASFTVKEGTVPANCAPASIQWQVSSDGGHTWSNVSGASFSGATTDALKIDPTSASESGHEFRAVLTNAHSETDSSPAALTATSPPTCAADPAIEEEPQSQTVTAPAEASFTVKEGTIPANCAPASIQWQVSSNGGASFSNVPEATSATLKINPTSASESGHEFRAILTNAHGETTSTAATLTVAAQAQAEPTALSTSLSGEGQTGTSVTVKEGAAVSDSATLAGNHAATATGKVTYKVYSDKECTEEVASAGAVSVSGEFVPASEAKKLAPGTYYWQASYSGDTANEKSASVCGAEVETVQAAGRAPTPRLAKEAVLAALEALVPSGDREDDKRIAEAIRDIRQSLDPKLWMNDEHLTAKKGEKVFQEEKEAVEHLRRVDDSAASAVVGLVAQLVEVDRTLAQVAIDAVTDPKAIAKAQKEMEKAAEELAEGEPINAIEHYKNAWKAVTKA